MRGNYISPSELLQAQRETGKSYWDLIGQPLTPAVGYNINNPYSESEKSYKQWYNTDAKQTNQLDTKASNDLVLNELILKYNNLLASMNKPKELKEYEYDDLPSFKKGKDKFTSFAQRLGPKIYKEMNKRGVYSDAAYDNVMRQLAMESSYGLSDVALKNHNYGGVGFNGKTYFNYKNDDAFVKDYIRMMKSKYGAALKAKNTTQYAKALKVGGYYQDSLENYTNKLNAMSSMSAAAKRHRLLNPKMYEYLVLLSDMEEPAVSTRVEKPINKEPVINTPIQTEAPLIPKPEYLESNSLIRKSFLLNISNMLLGREFLFTLPGFKKGKNSKKPLSDEQYFKIMEDVANENYKRWGLPNPDAALLQALNDNSYDYRGYYNKYPNGKGNAVDHWPDDFKTVYHPTFSDESIYSGHKNKFNPEGIVGGHWYNKTFIPSLDLLVKLKKLPGFTGGKDGDNWYEQFKEEHPTITEAASYLPVVGSAMDVYEAVKNPTGGNIANAAISVGADIFGYRLLKNAGKAYKTLKAVKKAKADDLIRRGFGKDYAKRVTKMDFFGDDEYARYLNTQLAVQGGDKVINVFQNKVEKERQKNKVGYARKGNAKK